MIISFQLPLVMVPDCQIFNNFVDTSIITGIWYNSMAKRIHIFIT